MNMKKFKLGSSKLLSINKILKDSKKSFTFENFIKLEELLFERFFILFLEKRLVTDK